MSQIDVVNLTFAYDGSPDNVFEDVSFRLDTDWRLGFTGRNGRGKTTFLNLLMGRYSYRGRISASVNFEYFPYAVEDMSAMTEDVILKLCDSPQWRILKEFASLELDEGVLWRPFETLSNGERTKVLLAAMFLHENSFLLIDEPTNHLDVHGREVLSRYLSTKKGYILVSHDRAFLDGCVDHILSINRTDIEVCKGDFSTWLADKERRDSFEAAENERLRKEIKRLEKTAKEKAAWSDKAESRKIGFDPTKVEKSMPRRAVEGAKAKKAMKRAKVIEGRTQAALEEKSSLLKNVETADALKLSQQPYHANRLVSANALTVDYGSGALFDPVSFEICRGDRIALCGGNGSGKSSILKLLLGQDIPHEGRLETGSRLTISYVPQDTSDLHGTLTSYAEECGIDESLFKAILRKLDFSRSGFDNNIESFSGGQKKKVLIAKSLCERANLLVWDEPLNFVDVISRIQLERLIADAAPTIVFVEHDSQFTQNTATKRIILNRPQ